MVNEELVNELKRHRAEVQNDFGWNTTLINALDDAIKALKCITDIKEYLTDPEVTWRDISDDCITDIMVKHGFMTEEGEDR